MSENKLKTDIEKLRIEISKLRPDETDSKERLEGLLQEIESGVEEEQSELLASLKESVEQFEAEHPRATAIINDIMVTLSNMGI